MSQKHIQIYDDSVLKLSIKQGEEADRFPNKGATIDTIDYSVTSTLPGAFTMGELAFTRDTGRVFVGNFTSEDEFLYDTVDGSNIQKIQQTVGGTLTGNKYLGYIDSKPAYNFSEGNDNLNSAPLSLTEDLAVNGIKSNALLNENSAFRSYEFTSNNSSECVITEDKKWSRQSFYNPTYDAYDGDYMYDVYRNALIIFDHNIKPESSYAADEAKPTETTPLNSRKRSIIQPLDTKNEAVKNFTKDMYGDGYVCIYNVIPDGDTLTFDSRKFNATTGKAEWGRNAQSKNYTYNTIKVQNVYSEALKPALDAETFNITNDKVYLQPKQAIAEITLPSSLMTGGEVFKYFTIPNEIALSENVKMQFKPFVPVIDNESNNYSLNFKLISNNNEEYLESSWVKIDPNAGKYTINLGSGLSNEYGESTIVLTPENPNGTIKFQTAVGDNKGLTNNPFNITSDNIDGLIETYTSNLVVGSNGTIINENSYSDAYRNLAEDFINQYENENTKINYLHRSIPIISATSGNITGTMKFRIQPGIYCVANNSSHNTVNIDKDEITINRETLNASYFNRKSDDEDYKDFSGRAKKQIITKNELKPLWIPGKNRILSIDTPAGYQKQITDSEKHLHVYNDINAMFIAYAQAADSPLSVHNVTDKNALEISVSGKGLFNIKFGNLEKSDVTLKNSVKDNSYDTLESIIEDFPFITPTNGTIVISEFLTTDLTKDTNFIMEALSANEEDELEVSIFSIPVKKYFDKLTVIDDQLISKIENNISKLEIAYSKTEVVTSVNGLNTVKTINTSDNLLTIDINNLTADFIEKIDNNYYIKPVVGNDGETLYQLLYINYIKDETVIDSFSFADEYISYIQLEDASKWDENFKHKCYYQKAAGETETEQYQFTLNGEYYPLSSTVYETVTREKRYYVATESDLNVYLDSWGFYYTNSDATICLRKFAEGENETAWLNEQRNKVLANFPVVPSHSASIILECKSMPDSSLTIHHVGNINENKGYTKPDIGGISLGINIPTTVGGEESTWSTYKNLLSVSGENTSYIEVPVSIDAAGNKHFTLKVDSTGEFTISVAGYKA